MDSIIPPEYLLPDDLMRLYNGQQRGARLEILRQTQELAFSSVGLSLGVDYCIIDVPISLDEWIHTILIQPLNSQSTDVFYLTHGFGGTSLFFYEFAAHLRIYGEVVLFDLRGMGFSSKFCPPLKQIREIIDYFVEPIEVVRHYYCHDQIIFVTHSFGSYITMLYTSVYEQRVKRQVVFSPIGITPKIQDNNSRIQNFKDFASYLVNKLGWKFQLTYKSLLKYFACCCKKAALKRSFRKYGCTAEKTQILAEIVMRLYEEPFASEGLFFKIFQPRVLPVYDMVQHYERRPCKTPTVIVYGETDWVDSQGAKYLNANQPEIFKVHELKEVGHQIFFQQRKGLIEELLQLILKF